MSVHRLFAFFVLATGFVLTSCSSPEQGTPVNISEARQHLQILSQARVLLGHRSVGRNILAGLEDLAEEAGVPIRIVAIDTVPPDDGAGVFHAEIGENGDPNSKCEIFEGLVNRPERPEYDLAMMKFCYSDLGRDTPLEVQAMLDRYASLLDDIHEERPDLRIVHISLPLLADLPGKKTFVKRLLGMETETDADNVLRNSFNDGLRQRYADEPFFDLAALESTRPDGSRSSFSHDSETIYTLAQELTDDGGHLNEEGQRRAAAEFARVLASALQDSRSKLVTGKPPSPESSASLQN